MGRPRRGSCVVDSIKLVSQLTETAARPNERARAGAVGSGGMKKCGSVHVSAD